MSQFSKELKTYAEQGLRTAEEWLSRGREVETSNKPRFDTINGGTNIALFSRDQTRPRKRAEANRT
jgi:hypothetical protein